MSYLLIMVIFRTPMKSSEFAWSKHNLKFVHEIRFEPCYPELGN